MENKEEPTITFRYKISPNYSVYSITGAHGGLNAQGNIIANFFSERSAVPRKETFKIDKNGNLSDQPMKVEKDNSIIRDVLFSISMTPQTARATAKWLNEKADDFEKLFSVKKEKK